MLILLLKFPVFFLAAKWSKLSWPRKHSGLKYFCWWVILIVTDFMIIILSIHVTRDWHFWNLNRVLKFTCQFWTSPMRFQSSQCKAMNYSLHFSINFKNNNYCFPSILNLFFSVNASFSERFPEKCSTFHSHVGHYKEKFECSFHSRKNWSCVTWIDCYINIIIIDGSRQVKGVIWGGTYSPFLIQAPHVQAPTTCTSTLWPWRAESITMHKNMNFLFHWMFWNLRPVLLTLANQVSCLFLTFEWNCP